MPILGGNNDVKIRISTEADGKGIDEVERKLGQLGDKVNETQKGFLNFSESARNASFLIAGGIAAIGTAAIGAAGFGVKVAADFETMRAGFITLLGSAQAADEALEMVKRDAASTPFEIAGLTQANQLLTSVTKDAQKSERFLLNVGKALTAMGKGQPELDRIIVNLQQIGAVGKASMLDIKQFAFAGIPIFEMLKDATGATGEELEEMIKDGAITFELLESIFNQAGEGTGRFATAFETMGGTFNQTLSNFKDNLNIVAAEFVKQTGIFDMAKAALQRLTDALGFFRSEEFFAGLRAFGNFIKENQGLIPIFAGVLMALLFPAFVTIAGAIWTAVAGMIAFAAPIIAVGALIAGLYLLWNNNFLGIKDITMAVVNWIVTYVWPTLQSIFGFIGSVLTTLGQIFVNVWNFIIKPLLTLFIKFLYNQFLKPFVDVFNFITDALNAMGVSWSDVWNGIKSVVFGIVNAMVSFIKNKINGIIDIINGLIRGANNVGDKIPGYTHINELPKLAQGVTNFRGGAAIVGERGPEIVTLPRGSNVIPNNEIGGALAPVYNVTQNNNIFTPADTEMMMRELGYAIRQ